MIGGELSSLIKDIDFNTKQELLDELRLLRQEVKLYSPKEKKQIMPYLNVAIQQAFYTREYELLKHKEKLLKKTTKNSKQVHKG